MSSIGDHIVAACRHLEAVKRLKPSNEIVEPIEIFLETICLLSLEHPASLTTSTSNNHLCTIISSVASDRRRRYAALVTLHKYLTARLKRLSSSELSESSAGTLQLEIARVDHELVRYRSLLRRLTSTSSAASPIISSSSDAAAADAPREVSCACDVFTQSRATQTQDVDVTLPETATAASSPESGVSRSSPSNFTEKTCQYPPISIPVSIPLPDACEMPPAPVVSVIPADSGVPVENVTSSPLPCSSPSASVAPTFASASASPSFAPSVPASVAPTSASDSPSAFTFASASTSTIFALTSVSVVSAAPASLALASSPAVAVAVSPLGSSPSPALGSLLAKIAAGARTPVATSSQAIRTAHQTRTPAVRTRTPLAQLTQHSNIQTASGEETLFTPVKTAASGLVWDVSPITPHPHISHRLDVPRGLEHERDREPSAREEVKEGEKTAS